MTTPITDLRTFDAWWFPATETVLPQAMENTNLRVDERLPANSQDTDAHAHGRLTWQYHKYLWSMQKCAQRRLAVDVGAHVGLFAFWMARDFSDVFAFEPVEIHQRCFLLNVPYAHVYLQPFALGRHDADVIMDYDPTSGGGARVLRHAMEHEAGASMTTLDSYGFEALDYLKIDCEGSELDVVLGAEATIRRCRPIILIESMLSIPPRRDGARPQASLEQLALWGAREHARLGNDVIVGWP